MKDEAAEVGIDEIACPLDNLRSCIVCACAKGVCVASVGMR